METFYATLARICFTLVGLWWVVVQFKYESLVNVAVVVLGVHFAWQMLAARNMRAG